MTTVAINEKYISALTLAGSLELAVDQALQRYSIEQISDKIAELKRQIQHYEAIYKMPFGAFANETAQDPHFVEQLEANGHLTWEIDLADWEFCHYGIQDWTETLNNILLT
ncbi:MAG: hypothetical protein KC423_24145 [Anaerolineales bacterium]|nr:hypothetical protein [Anaerolineales bacterium]MCB9433828.1 hypothetical protein [Ardenticatenaceae bacterium]